MRMLCMQAGNIMLQAWCLMACSLLGSRLLHPSYASICLHRPWMSALGASWL